MSSGNTPIRSGMVRLGHVALLAALAVAFTGYVVGLSDRVAPDLPAPIATTPPVDRHDVPPAPTYTEMASRDLGPNAAWSNALPAPKTDPDRLFASVVVAAGDQAAAVARRAERRAYDGAPPVIPHAIDQASPASCIACHGRGLHVGTVTAPRMSHEMHTNCTQCHVESVNRALPPIAALRVGGNRFEGLPAPGPGERAWPGAPPTIPHTTWMRQQCASCHGDLARKGLRTPHPWRVNCQQCHAPSAELDQVRWNVTGRIPWPAPGATP